MRLAIAAGACLTLFVAIGIPEQSYAQVDRWEAFLVQARCPDGSLPLRPCSGKKSQTADMPLGQRRHDWPAPDGYQISDSFVGWDGRPQQVWTFRPFGPVNIARGDGGEIYQRLPDGGWSAAATQDGGTPGMQYFVGPRCGGAGWLIFRPNPPTGHWASEVARLSGTRSPNVCPPLGQAFTRWRREKVAVPFLISGKRRDITVDAIISEHFDNGSLASARHLERAIYAKGFGRLIWEAWGREPARVNLEPRCPGTAWSKPPVPGWQLEDCRYATNISQAWSTMTGRQLGWP